MTLKSGDSLGHYQVHERIGAGGMGEVFRATDTTLRRDVAIKLLPDAFARDAERVSRFKREAQLLAALNHPNIATIHGLFSHPTTDGPQYFLVMELVTGQTLAEIIQQCRDRKGAGVGFGVRGGESKNQALLAGARGTVTGLPIDEALNITTQICEALEHAHEHGVIHRDLKPTNVKVTPEGKVKVLDFGLAKAFAAAGASGEASPNPGVPYDSQSPTLAASPTLTASPTIPGVILGTAAYMSPEQAKGKSVDRRTDIWALGCVLFEMLTGRGAFEGESVTEILGAVMRAEPDWALLPADTPPGIHTLLRRCLQKDAAKRSRDAGELRFRIEESTSPIAPGLADSAAPTRRWLLVATAACALVVAIVGAAVWMLRPATATISRPVQRVAITLPRNTFLTSINFDSIAFSPDGRRLAYLASGGASQAQLYMQPLDGLEAIALAGTEDAYVPFFSPDGEWIAFGSGNMLKKISVSGGAALTLSNLTGTLRGGAWAPDNTIVYSSGAVAGLTKVSSAGGETETFTTLQPGEIGHRWPQFLPDGKTVLFTIATTGNYDDALIAVQKIGSSERKVVVRGGTHGRYLPSGHLVYYRAGVMTAVPFDPVAIEVKGAATPVVEEVLGFAESGSAQFTVSDSGSLAYIKGSSTMRTQTMVWVNRQGVATPINAPPRNYRAPALSPDGTKVAVGIGSDVWVYDIQRDTLTRLTFERDNASTAARWTPDSKHILFASDRAGPINIFSKPADGSGVEERLTTSPNVQRAGSSSSDGRFQVFTEIGPKTGNDVMILPTEGDRKPYAFLQTAFNERSGQFSPDDRWIAYVSDESGRMEVYVRPFPGPGGKWQISTEGGNEFTWNPKGRELFYRTGMNKEKMMVVEYETQPTFSAGKPRLLFEGNYVANLAANPAPFYSVSPDGQRFLMTRTPDQPQETYTQINLVLNWFEELKQKVPVQ